MFAMEEGTGGQGVNLSLVVFSSEFLRDEVKYTADSPASHSLCLQQTPLVLIMSGQRGKHEVNLISLSNGQVS